MPPSYEKVGQVDADDLEGAGGVTPNSRNGSVSAELALSGYVLRVACILEAVVAMAMSFSHCFWFSFFAVEAIVGLRVYSVLKAAEPSPVVASQIGTFLRVKGLSLVLGLAFLPLNSNGLFDNLATDVLKLVWLTCMALIVSLSCFGGIVSMSMSRNLPHRAARDLEMGGAEGFREEVPLTTLHDNSDAGETASDVDITQAEWEAEKQRLQEIERAHAEREDEHLELERQQIELAQAQSLAESRPPREEKKKKKGSKAAEVDPAAQAMLDQLRAEGRHDEADALEKVIMPAPAPEKKKKKSKKSKGQDSAPVTPKSPEAPPPAPPAPPAPYTAPVPQLPPPPPPPAATPASPSSPASPPAAIQLAPGQVPRGELSMKDFEWWWSNAPHQEEDTVDMVYELEAKDVEEFMVSAEFRVMASGPGEDGTTKMYFQTVASKVPILFEPTNDTAILAEVVHDQADSQITITCKSTDEDFIAGTLSFASDLFAG